MPMSKRSQKSQYILTTIIISLIVISTLVASIYEFYNAFTKERLGNLKNIVGIYSQMITELHTQTGSRASTIETLKRARSSLDKIKSNIEFEFIYKDDDGDIKIISWENSPRLIRKNINLDINESSSELIKNIIDNKSGSLSTKNHDGGSILAAHHYIEPLEMSLVGKIHMQELQKYLSSLTEKLVTITLLITLSLIIVYIFFDRQKKRIEKKFEQEMKKNLDTLNAYKKGMDTHSMICITDRKGLIMQVNARFVKNSGYSQDELIGHGFSQLKSGEHDNTFYKNLWKTIQSNRVWHGQIKNKRKDGSFFWVDTTITPIKLDNLDGYICIQTEITDKKLFEERLIMAKAYAEVASERKSLFLSHISHEIRTPLSSIIGYVELLEKDDFINEQTKKYVKTIKRNSTHLADLVGEVLDFSKIEAGQLEIKKVTFPLKKEVEKIKELYDKKSPKIAFRVEYQYPLPENITTDPLRFRQVMINLISNAFKFTEKGSIKVIFRLSKIEFDEPSDLLTIEVHDTGMGMDPKFIKTIFTAFAQAKSFYNRKKGGTGLGLSLSKELTQLLGGDLLLVKSVVHRGSIFKAYFDYGGHKHNKMIWKESELDDVSSILNNTPQFNKTKPIEGTRILLVEDSSDIAELIRIHIEDAGADLQIAQTAEKARQLLSSDAFDLILLDIQLPKISGHQFIKEIRIVDPSIPVIAITAHSTKTEKNACLKNGFNDFITKPINFNCLIASIQKFNENNLNSISKDLTHSHLVTPLYSSLSDNQRLTDQLRKFSSTFSDKIKMCNNLNNTGDWDSLTSYCHKIKGAYGTYGYPELQEIADNIEKLSMTHLQANKKRKEIRLQIKSLSRLSHRASIVYNSSH
jgi:PAS domain S-box-containing protein